MPGLAVALTVLAAEVAPEHRVWQVAFLILLVVMTGLGGLLGLYVIWRARG